MRSRVLVVEDDDLAAVTTIRILERAGHEARRAASAAEVDELLIGGWTPTCILFDRNLGGQDGMSVAMQLRQRLGADCPRLVLLSGDPPSAAEQRLFAAHLLKPTDISSLLAAVSGDGKGSGR